MSGYDLHIQETDSNVDGAISPLLDAPAGVVNNLPTPPHIANDPAIQISPTFSLNSTLDSVSPDTIIASLDHVFFAVHHHRLLASSVNNFGGCLNPHTKPTHIAPFTFIVQESSDVLNVVLHTTYHLSCDNYSPSFECLYASVQALKKYGFLPLQRLISRGTPLFTTILNRAIQEPIKTYALAAANELEDLAVSASAYTLPVKLHLIPQELVDKIGTRYLQRLYKLHGNRLDNLRELLGKKLFPHVAKPYCSVEKRQVVSRALQLAATQVMYDATPATTRVGIESGLLGVVSSVSCPDCEESVNAHVKDVATQWMIMDRTI
ncbi:hypothetical protein BC835DRAFT_156979 [Cytidiella melzeri]|nr:hypothetical protein BC835DRAFT_156979 [Cytidiella melzeri]